MQFWTYSCINCVRTLPYLKAWHDRYGDQGLVILGIHTPEFEFEKSHDNVERAVRQQGIRYLVAQDNGYATWEAYSNRYWPAKYLVDATGRVRYTHFGEGKYQETEAAIQALLAEAGMSSRADAPAPADYTLARGRTPELYLGAARGTNIASPERVTVGGPGQFSVPANLPLHRFAFDGEWTVDREDALAGPGSRLDLEFMAGDVYLVLVPPEGGEEVEVLLDGRPIEEARAGRDVHGGRLAVDEARLYHLVSLREGAGRHRLSLRFHQGGTRAFAFTFG